MASRNRLLDLLAARATEGLSAAESGELERALQRQQDLGLNDLDLAAAAVYLAFDASCAETEPMPDRLKQRILEQGLRDQQAD